MNNNIHKTNNSDPDMDFIQSKLQSLKSKNTSNPKSTYALKIEKPKKVGEENSSIVRILPYRHNESNWFFIDTFFHYNIGTFGHIACPKLNFNEPCAICDHVQEIYDRSNQVMKDNGIDIKDSTEKKRSIPEVANLWKIANALKAKKRIYVPVVVRGKESEGVKYWGQAPKLNDELIGYLGRLKRSPLNRYAGWDTIVIYKNDGTQFGNISFQFILEDDPKPILPQGSNEEVDKFVNEVPDIWDVFLERKSSSDVEHIVDKLMNSETNTMDLSNNENETSTHIEVPIKHSPVTSISDNSNSFATTDDMDSQMSELKKMLEA